jgi:hypothetical protein
MSVKIPLNVNGKASTVNVDAAQLAVNLPTGRRRKSRASAAAEARIKAGRTGYIPSNKEVAGNATSPDFCYLETATQALPRRTR